MTIQLDFSKTVSTKLDIVIFTSVVLACCTRLHLFYLGVPHKLSTGYTLLRQLYNPDAILSSLNSALFVSERRRQRQRESFCSLQRNVNWSVVPSYSLSGSGHIYSVLWSGQRTRDGLKSPVRPGPQGRT